MSVVRTQLGGQLAGTAEADRCVFDIHQQRRASARGQGRPVAQAAIGDDQQALTLGRMQALAARLPGGGLLYGSQQGRAAAGAQFPEPLVQGLGGFLPLPQPLRLAAGGVEQGQARALPAGLLEQLAEQTLGLAQRAMAPGRGRGIDYHQPEFGGFAAARTLQQILTIARAALEQGRRPVDNAQPTAAAGTAATTLQRAGGCSGIRTWGCARAAAGASPRGAGRGGRPGVFLPGAAVHAPRRGVAPEPVIRPTGLRLAALAAARPARRDWPETVAVARRAAGYADAGDAARTPPPRRYPPPRSPRRHARRRGRGRRAARPGRRAGHRRRRRNSAG